MNHVLIKAVLDTGHDGNTIVRLCIALNTRKAHPGAVVAIGAVKQINDRQAAFVIIALRLALGCDLLIALRCRHDDVDLHVSV